MNRRAYVFALAALLLTTGAVAGDPPQQIFEPTIITEPGHYVLMTDLSSLAEYCVIRIAADDVDLDLNGFRLSIDRGNVICASDVSRVSVHDGILTTGAVGDDATGVSFQGVQGFILTRLTAYAPCEFAFAIESSRNGVIEDNRILGSEEGVLAIGTDIVIRKNVINTGIHASGNRFRIVGNALTSTPEDPSDVGNISIGGNGNLIEENFAGTVSLWGTTSRNNVIRNNVLHAGDGVVIFGHHNRILGNFSTSGSGFGLRFATGSTQNVYGGNKSFGNHGENCPSPAGNANFCDYGTANVSLGDNYLPDPM